jgi:hypothetical protein
MYNPTQMVAELYDKNFAVLFSSLSSMFGASASTLLLDFHSF